MILIPVLSEALQTGTPQLGASQRPSPPGFATRQSTRWTKWNCDRSFSMNFGFPLSIAFHQSPLFNHYHTRDVQRAHYTPRFNTDRIYTYIIYVGYIYIILYIWRSWLRHCATNRQVAASIPDGVGGFLHWHNPVCRTMALGSTQPLTEMSTSNISWGVNAAGTYG
jgi:hypothetical protein